MAMGVNPTRYKILAFMVSAALTAAGGVLYAIYISFFEPHLIFNLELSVELALMAYIGGAGTILGPAVGAILLQLAGDAFRQWSAALGGNFQQANLLIYGILIIVVIRFAPEGLAGAAARLVSRWQQATPAARARREMERA
jgi:branched-chain amino acid transport system permease protein